MSTNDHCCIDDLVGDIGATRIHLGSFSAGVLREVNVRQCVPVDDHELRIKLAGDLGDDEMGAVDLSLKMGSELTCSVSNGDADYEITYVVESESPTDTALERV